MEWGLSEGVFSNMRPFLKFCLSIPPPKVYVVCFNRHLQMERYRRCKNTHTCILHSFIQYAWFFFNYSTNCMAIFTLKCSRHSWNFIDCIENSFFNLTCRFSHLSFLPHSCSVDCVTPTQCSGFSPQQCMRSRVVYFYEIITKLHLNVACYLLVISFILMCLGGCLI